MRRLTVFYDPSCGLCSQVRDWLKWQPAYIPLALIPAGSAQAKRLCPAAETVARGDLLVVGDDGSAWRGDHAWIVCLWALRQYRNLSYRLASPVLLPLARQAFHAISHQRARISEIFGLQSENEIADRLRQSPLLFEAACRVGPPLGRHDD